MSKLKVVSFPAKQKDEQFNGDNVEQRIAELTEMLKANDIENIVIVAVKHDGSVIDCWANGSCPFVIVGALESVKLEFMNACIEGR